MEKDEPVGDLLTGWPYAYPKYSIPYIVGYKDLAVRVNSSDPSTLDIKVGVSQWGVAQEFSVGLNSKHKVNGWFDPGKKRGWIAHQIV